MSEPGTPEDGAPAALTGSRAHPLARAVTALGSHLELPRVLDTLLSTARELTGAEYAALNILDADGRSKQFFFEGMDESIWKRLGRGPSAVGVLAQIPLEGVLSIPELTEHPAFQGLPKGHPPMGSFLGTALSIRGELFGYLYLANTPVAFTETDAETIVALASAAAVAIDHANLYAAALEREHWIEASREITALILTDPTDDAGLQRVTELAREIGRATTAVLVLPGAGDQWVMEITSGAGEEELLGLALPEDGHAMDVIREAEGVISPMPPGSHVLNEVSEYGPSLYVPLVAEGTSKGLLMLWREVDDAPFGDDDLVVAQRFANQAALALSLAELAHAKNVTTLLEERERIADDLHDFVSQELFATAMQLETIASDADDGIATRLMSTLEHVKRAQREVRGVMASLAGQRSSEPLSSRLQREILMAAPTLGFAPQVTADWTSVDIAVVPGRTVGDDAVAVVRELLSNVARHAGADAVDVVVQTKDGRLRIEVVDNGKGPAGATTRHSGTSNLAGRALRRNGTFSLVEAHPGRERPGSVAMWEAEIG